MHLRSHGVTGLVLLCSAFACGTSPAAGVAVDDQTAPSTYANPVAGHGADPGVLEVAGTYLMVTTSGSSPNALPVRASKDLVRWEDVGPVMPREKWPSWATGDFWAPELHRVGDRHVAFFTARWDRTQKPSIGVAWTKDLERWARGEIAWPDVVWETAPAPLVADDRELDPEKEDRSGMIDPTFVEDGDRRYVFFNRDLWTNKPDGVWRHEGEILAQEIAIGGEPWLAAASDAPRTKLLGLTEPWEADVIEGAFVVFRDGFFHLLYSANRYWEGRYVVSDARSRSPLGPYEKRGAPLLQSTDAFKGPGHGSLVSKGGQDWFVYHAYAAGAVGNDHPRLVMLDPVTWGEDGWPAFAGPSSGPRPAP